MNDINLKAVREELARALSQRFDDSQGIAVYGAGDVAGRSTAPAVDKDEKFGEKIEIKYFIDDTPAKYGTVFQGKPVINFQEAHSLCKSFLILPCSFVPETLKIMEQSLRADPIEGAKFCSSFDEYIFCKHAKEVLSVYDMMRDDLSKATYANIILARMGKANQNMDFTVMDQYFSILPFKKRDFREVFVDCGAFVGDTIEEFIKTRDGVFNKVIAFEPNEGNYRAMKFRAERLSREWGLKEGQIELVQAGIGERTYCTKLKTLSYATGGSLSGESDHGDIPVISLDEYFAERPIAFLKADIEGYELRMLHGAEQVIKRDRPKMAICIYHSPFDMYRLALWIKSVCPDYQFDVRQHCYNAEETVLYAYTTYGYDGAAKEMKELAERNLRLV